jgi:hypothetical protein
VEDREQGLHVTPDEVTTLVTAFERGADDSLQLPDRTTTCTSFDGRLRPTSLMARTRR